MTRIKSIVIIVISLFITQFSVCYATSDTIYFGSRIKYYENQFAIDSNIKYVGQIANGYLGVSKKSIMLDLHSMVGDTISSLSLKYDLLGADDSASISTNLTYYSDFVSIDSNSVIRNLKKIPFYHQISLQRIKPYLSFSMNVGGKYLMPSMICDSAFNQSQIKFKVTGIDSMKINLSLDSSVSFYTKLGIYQFPKLIGTQYDASYNEIYIPISYSINSDSLTVNIGTYNTQKTLFIQANRTTNIGDYNLNFSNSEKVGNDSALYSLLVDDYSLLLANETLQSNIPMRFDFFGSIQKKYSQEYRQIKLETYDEYLSLIDSKFIGILPKNSSIRIMQMKMNNFGEIIALGNTDARINGEFDSLLIDTNVYAYYSNSRNFLLNISKYNNPQKAMYLNTLSDTAKVLLSDFYVDGYDYYFVGSATDITDSSYYANCTNCSMKGIANQKLIILKYDEFYKMYDRMALFGSTVNNSEWVHSNTITAYYDTLRKKELLLVGGVANSRYFLNTNYWNKSDNTVDNFILKIDKQLDTLFQVLKIGGSSDEGISTFTTTNWYNHRNKIFVDSNNITFWGISNSTQSSFIPSQYSSTCLSNGKTYSNYDVYALRLSQAGHYTKLMYINGNMDDYLIDVKYSDGDFAVLTSTKSNILPLAGYSILANYDSVSANTSYEKGFINIIGHNLLKITNSSLIENYWSSYLEADNQNVYHNSIDMSGLYLQVPSNIQSAKYYKFTEYLLNSNKTTSTKDGTITLIKR